MSCILLFHPSHENASIGHAAGAQQMGNWVTFAAPRHGRSAKMVFMTFKSTN